MYTHPDVVVVGAGVSGLTTAVRLAESGLAVVVRTRDHPRRTTSCAAGAIWGPYLVDDHRVYGWSELTRSVLEELAGDPTSTGVRLAYGLEAGRVPVDPPGWARSLAGYREADCGELPAGYVSGWWYTAPVLDMPAYLSYLAQRLASAGAVIETGRFRSLAELSGLAPVTVNCAGIGARELVPDAAVTANRGQVVVVDNPGVGQFFVEHDESPDPTYFLPHGRSLVLGGSAEWGLADLTPDLDVSAEIQRRCAAIEPLIADARVREHRVGLRPSRPRVRLERAAVAGGTVIHNYGHGGSGVTLSWGCADEVLALITGP